MKLLTIRSLTPDDYDQWRWLREGYADFYQVVLTADVARTTWSWLVDARHVCAWLVVEQFRYLIGLAHFFGVPSPLRGQMIGFLSDLFKLPEHRSGGVAAELIRAVQAPFKVEGRNVVRWITRKNNYWARSYHDKFAEKTDWTLYETTEK